MTESLFAGRYCVRCGSADHVVGEWCALCNDTRLPIPSPLLRHIEQLERRLRDAEGAAGLFRTAYEGRRASARQNEIGRPIPDALQDVLTREGEPREVAPEQPGASPLAEFAPDPGPPPAECVEGYYADEGWVEGWCPRR